jgi:hypothetical protein
MWCDAIIDLSEFYRAATGFTMLPCIFLEEGESIGDSSLYVNGKERLFS